MASPVATKIAEKHNAGIGHNSGVPADLKSYVDRLVALEEEKASAIETIRELKKEAADKGIDPLALQTVVKWERQTPDQAAKRERLQELLDKYWAAIA